MKHLHVLLWRIFLGLLLRQISFSLWWQTSCVCFCQLSNFSLKVFYDCIFLWQPLNFGTSSDYQILTDETIQYFLPMSIIIFPRIIWSISQLPIYQYHSSPKPIYIYTLLPFEEIIPNKSRQYIVSILESFGNIFL